MFCVAFDEGFDERCLPHSWRSDDGDDLGRWIEGQAVDLGDMEALLFDLEDGLDTAQDRRGEGGMHVLRANSLLGQSAWFGIGKGFGVAVCEYR